MSRHTACIPTAIQLIHHGPELWTDWLTPRTDAQAALSVLEGRGAQNKRRSTLSRPSATNQDEPRKARESTASYDSSTNRPVAALTIIGCPTVNAGCPTTTRKASWRPYLLPIPFQRAPAASYGLSTARPCTPPSACWCACRFSVRTQLARQLGIDPRQVQIWFQVG